MFGDEVNITTEGQRHLGAVIGSLEFKDQYCREKVLGWKGELKALSEIARSQPHAAYTVFTKGYKSTLTYFMRTIESFEDYVDPAASWSITAPQIDSITTQSMFMVAGENSIEELKRQHQALKTASVKMRMESIDSTLPSDLQRSVNQSRDKGASSWLTAVPLVDQGLVLNKQEFRDSLRLRYNMPLSDLPSKCVCGEKYTVCHALSCKNEGFVAQRHDRVRNLLISLIGKVCTNVEFEPQLQPLANERFSLRSAVTSPEARLEFKAGGFLIWSRGVTAFFDARVTYVNSKCKQGKATSTIFKEQEKEKNRKYQQRVLDVEMGSFSPLVFGTNGGMGADCNCFHYGMLYGTVNLSNLY